MTIRYNKGMYFFGTSVRLPRSLLVGFLCTLCFALPEIAFAGVLSRVSDLISTSEPATPATHTITFTTKALIPLGGKIVIRPDGTVFDFPSGMNFTDIDIATGPSGGPFVDRPLAGSASPSADGVLVTTGLGGLITITLGDTGSGAIAATTTVVMEIGQNATFGGGGAQNIINPNNIGSYRIRIETYDASDVFLDDGTAMIAIVEPVGVGPVDTTDTVPPTRSNGRPTGTLPASTAAVQLVLNTDKFAFCRWAATSSTPYASMTNDFTQAGLGLLHYKTVTGLVPGTTYDYYVRCINGGGAGANPDDYLISFTISASSSPPSPNPTPPGPPPSPLNGNGGRSGVGGGNQGGGPYLKGGDVTLDGKTFPGGTLVILKDGVVAKEAQVDTQGVLNASFTNLERGTYTWGIYAKDAKGRRTATYSSTIFLLGGTNNVIAPIFLSPTIGSAANRVEIGEDVVVEGYAIPSMPVVVLLNKQGEAESGKVTVATTTAKGSGEWSVHLPTTGLDKGTYEVKAQSQVGGDASGFSPLIYIGVGESARPDFTLRSDLNGDKKVNLVDFSILLYHWKTADPTADINQDGTVNITDFSILLSNWTG